MDTGVNCRAWQSMAADLTADRRFALLTRSRQQEELYIRALYAMFIATPDEVIHIMSDATPNSFSAMYKRVNQSIFGGKGLLDVVQPGLTYGHFPRWLRSTVQRTHPSRHYAGDRPHLMLIPQAVQERRLLDHISVYFTISIASEVVQG